MPSLQGVPGSSLWPPAGLRRRGATAAGLDWIELQCEGRVHCRPSWTTPPSLQARQLSDPADDVGGRSAFTSTGGGMICWTGTYFSRDTVPRC